MKLAKIYCSLFLFTLLTPLQSYADMHDPYLGQVTTKFHTATQNNDDLLSFLTQFPKGGELHDHLTGAVYPADLIQIAAKNPNIPWCVNLTDFKFTQDSHCVDDGGVLAVDAMPYIESIKKAWSMYQYKLQPPNYGLDHVFDWFSKLNAFINDSANWPDFLAFVKQQAGDENISYLELQLMPDRDYNQGNTSVQYGERYLKKIFSSTNKITYQDVVNAIDTLDAHQFETNVVKNNIIQTTSKMVQNANTILKCHQNNNLPGCDVKVRFLYYGQRDQLPNIVFANFYAGFLAVKDAPNLFVGVNLVEPEGGENSLKYYDTQMMMLKYLQQYFAATYHIKIPLALHAGNLTVNIAPAKDLTFHINDALKIAGALRVGHAVDVMSEVKQHPDLLQYMAQQHRLAEINLTSNEDTEGACDKMSYCFEPHPLREYLTHHVPVSLSTDDQGIFQINLLDEYLKAVTRYHLSYIQIKNIARNAITYSFLPGKQLWASLGNYQHLTQQCADDNPYVTANPSLQCQTFLQNNLKAKVEWQLEQRFARFEHRNSQT